MSVTTPAHGVCVSTLRKNSFLGLASGLMLCSLSHAHAQNTVNTTQAPQSININASTNSPPTEPDPYESNIADLIRANVNRSAIKITVRAIGKNNYVAVLTGRVAKQEILDEVGERARKVVEYIGATKLHLIVSVKIDKDPTPPTIVTRAWSFAHLQGDAAFDGKVDLTHLADALNGLFPAGTDIELDSKKPLCTLKDTTLWIHGEESLVQQVRALLVLIDAPAPQVRMDVWALQYAGDQKAVGEQLHRLAGQVAMTQKAAEFAKEALAAAVRTHADQLIKEPAFQQLSNAGFAADPHSSLSLIEALICMGISEKRPEIIEEARTNLDKMMHDGNFLRPEINLLPDPNAVESINITRVFKEHWLTKAFLSKKENYFPNLTLLMTTIGGPGGINTLCSDLKSTRDYADSLINYTAFVDELEMFGKSVIKNNKALEEYPNAPETLARMSLTIDRHIEHLINAFTADIQQMFFDPLLAKAQSWKYGGQGGVGLAGRTRIVVTNRLSASLIPALETYGEKSVPNTLGEDFVNSLVPGATNSAGTTTTPASAATSAIIAGLSGPEGAILKAALQPTETKSFYSVAPGISLTVTPAMTPDGTTANLKINATFGVDTHITKESNQDTLTYRPPDAVKSHQVQTVANVGGFNLFEISSFNMDTITPRTAYILPVFGNLPIVGNMFRFSHSPQHTFHQSIILVNATLIPRSLGIVDFYGANFAGSGFRSRLDAGSGPDAKKPYPYAEKLYPYDQFKAGKLKSKKFSNEQKTTP